MRRRPLVLAGCLAAAVAAGAGVLAVVGHAGGTDDQQGTLASLISSALSSQATQVRIGGVDGALSSDATIRDVVISDRDGPWLKLDRAHIAWRRAALLLRRLEIEDLAIGHLEILRRPILKHNPDKPLLPDLPVKVEIKRFAMADLDLGAPILGAAMRAQATGRTVLGSPSEGLQFSLDGKRLDSPGSLEADLDYVPNGQALHVKVALDEPSGGLLSQVAHLPGQPPVTFRLGGDGTLDAFEGWLTFRAGPAIDADGKLTLRRHDTERDTGRDLAVRVGGRLGALLPAVAAPIFEGGTDLVSDARFGDDGGFSLGRLALTSHLARLDAHGTLGADSTMDFDLAVRALPSRGDATTLGGATIRKLVLDAAAQGTVRQPRLRAALSVADADLPQGRLGALDARFAATPSGDVTSADTRLTLEGGAEATGVAPRDPRLAQAIGGSARLALDGHVDRHGVATFETLAAETPTASLAYAGDLASSRVHGRLTARAPDLSRLGGLAGLPLAGSVAAGLDLDGAPDARTLRASLAASGRDLATGLPAVDGLTGRKVDARGSLRLAGDGLTVDDLALDAAHVSARVAGTIPARSDTTRDAATPPKLDAHVVLPDLARADPRLTGAARIDAKVTGDLAKPAVTLDAALDGATALGRPIPHLALVAHVTDPRGAAVADATLDGSVDRKPARGQLALARHGRGWDLSRLDVAIGSVAVRGGGRIDDGKLVDGSLRLAAGNLDDLSPLALTKLGGTLSLDAAFAAPDAKQNATLTARADDLVAGPASLHALAVRAEASDLYGKPVVDADAKLDRATVAGQTISAASLTAKGAASRSAINLSARAAGFDLDAAGALLPDVVKSAAKGAATRLELASFSARRGAHRIALAGPATLTLVDGGVTIDRLALGISGGRVAVSGRAGKVLDLTAEAKAIPLAAADIVMPGLGLSGTLEADAHIGGTPADPTGPYHVTIKHLVAPQAKEAGLPPIDVAATGKLGNHRAALDAKIAAGRAGTLQANGSLPLDAAGMIDLAVHGKLDAAVANARLSADGRTVTGSVLVDAKLAGTRAAPRLSGNATMSGGTFRDALYGVRLDNIEARVAAKGDRVSVERLAASTANGGRLSGSGEVKIDPAAGFPGTVSLQGRDAQLAASSLMTATANLDLSVSGALARAPRVAGHVDLIRARVGVPDRLPTTLQPLPGVTHVNPSSELAAKLAAARKKERLAAKGRKSRPALFEAALDVTVAADNGIFVRGRGIDAELGGKLHVTGSTSKPVPQGGFNLTHGTIAALGKTLSFSKGDVSFSGDLMPEVDFVAQISAPDITAQVAVTGPATAPAFKFSSTPELPQDEILSRVMFQKPSGSLSGFQALQLAQAAAQFSGDGDSAYQKMMSSLGVVPSASGDDGPMSKISRALGDRVSVGVVTGATADQTGLSADVAVTKHLRVQSDVRSNGATSVGVGSEIEY